MKQSFDADERTGADLVLFAMGFAGFILGAAGLVLRSIAVASIGGLLLSVAVISFCVRRSPGD